MPQWKSDPLSDGVTIAEALRKAAARLESSSDTARLDAELLLAHALGQSRSDILLASRDALADSKLDLFARLVDRRAVHEPVAYITGMQEFFGLPFAVAPGVLIPRADSESVVQAALDEAPSNARVLDCGTGPGTLLLTFLAQRPAATGIGIDASPIALGIAATNCEALGMTGRAQFLKRDWTQAGWTDQLGTFDLILANPPYVEDAADLAPDVRDFEPSEALFAGPDGLDDYRVLIPFLPALLTANGVAVLEIGATQHEKVEKIAAESGLSARICHDLGGRPRACVLRLGLGK